MNKIKNKKPKHLKDGRTKFNIFKGIKNLKFKFKKQSSLIVADFELTNGDTEMFIVEVKKDSFKLFGKRYLILENYTTSQIVQKVFAGEKMQDIFGFIKLMLILLVVGVAISCFILVSMV